MSRNRFNVVFGAVLLGMLGLSPITPSAGEIEQSGVVDDMLVYLGVVPATTLTEDPVLYGEHNMQCPAPHGHNIYHVMVVIFDRSNGQRITDADVSARVSPLGLVGPTKQLDAVSVADAPMYCDYFELSKGDTYDIKVQIRRSNAASPVLTSFVYRPPTD